MIPFFYYVEKGNNGNLIKQLFQKRWWWQKGKKEAKSQLNLYWSQKIKSDFVNGMPVKTHKTESNSDAFSEVNHFDSRNEENIKVQMHNHLEGNA